MINASVMMALAGRLEEEGITSPNVEAEVSASVEVSPEVQTQIDEAVTEIEAVTEASDELEEATETEESIEETTATLSAIVSAIHENGGTIHPQLYHFLDKSGYLSLIAATQSDRLTKITYPATESIGYSVNSRYSDSILAGCENAITEFGKSIWERIKKIIQKIKEFFQKIYTYIVANEKRVTAANQSLQNVSVDVNVDEIKYSETKPTSDNMKQIADAVESLSKPLIEKVQKYMIGLHRFVEFSKTMKNGNLDDVLPKLDQKEFDAITRLGEMKIGGSDTLGKAGFTLNDLQTSTYKNVLSCVKGMKELKPVIGKLNDYYKTLNKVSQVTGFFNKEAGNDVREQYNMMFGDISKISKGFNVLYTSCWKVVNSYLTICSSIAKASKSSKKDEK